MTEKLRAIIERAGHWPEAAQDEAVASLESIERDYIGGFEIPPADLAALARSEEDIRGGRIFDQDKADDILTRFRGI